MSIYQFSVKDKNNQLVKLDQYKGKVLLIVNTATRCGYTPQFKQLEEIYNEYKAQGFEVIGFPCNQFLKQAPEEIHEFLNACSLNYGVTFTQFNKINVNGKEAIELYQYLKKQIKNSMGTERVLWNFEKFLINKKGEVVARYSPKTDFETIITNIKTELKK